MRFSKQNRLLKTGEFDATFDNGRKVVSRHLVVVGRKNSNLPRLGLVVSRKVGSAVTRNRVKRFIRESFRIRLPETQAADFVVVARHSAGSLTYDALNQELTTCLARLESQLPQHVS